MGAWVRENPCNYMYVRCPLRHAQFILEYVAIGNVGVVKQCRGTSKFFIAICMRPI